MSLSQLFLTKKSTCRTGINVAGCQKASGMQMRTALAMCLAGFQNTRTCSGSMRWGDSEGKGRRGD